MISITGRRPHTALPNAAPASASSEIGVSNTRSGPKRSASPGVVANTPPAAATSSPKKITRSSCSSSSASASRIASLNSSSAILELARVGIGRGERRGQSVLNELLDFGLHRRLHRFGAVDRVAQSLQRVALAPLVQLAGLAVAAGVAARMADEAVRQRLDEARAIAGASLLHGLGRSVAHGPNVVAVGRPGGDAQRFGARPDLTGRHLLVRRELAVQVVLAHVDGGQLEDLREVEAFGEITLVGGAVAEERHRHPVLALQGERRARGRRDAAAHDPEAADQPVLEVDHVHRSGPPAAYSAGPPEELVEQALRLNTQRERMAVAAVGPGHPVLRLQHRAHAHRHRLLPRVQVRGAVHLALEEQVLHRVLEAPDQQHPAVELERLVAVANGFSLRRLGAAHFAATGSSPFTRSAPRTYCRPATSSSSAGKRVRISGPSAVTTTSPSTRAAERPPLAGPYVSRAE